MTYCRTLILLALVIAAIALNATIQEVDPAQTLCAQGGIRPLLSAEAGLKTGDQGSSLKNYQIVAMRASHTGQPGLFNRIRFRLGLAGQEEAPRNFQASWPFLARYVLWTNQFPSLSRVVEEWVLQRNAGTSSFAYPLTTESGQTVWGETPIKAFLGNPRLPTINPPAFGPLTLVHQARENDLPAVAKWGWVYPCHVLVSALEEVSVALSVSDRPGSHVCFVAENRQVQWSKPLQCIPGGSSASFSLPEPWYLDLLVLGPGPLPPLTAVVIHDYKSIS